MSSLEIVVMLCSYNILARFWEQHIMIEVGIRMWEKYELGGILSFAIV
jgi:hypothetical protein